MLIVGASRGAADDLARAAARSAGATFGLRRFSVIELAARAAACAAGDARVPGTQAGAEAVAARAVFEAGAQGELAYFAPVAGMPGFPKALARTVYELRLARVSSDRLVAGGAAGADLGCLATRIEQLLDAAGVDDRAALYSLAAEACSGGLVPWIDQPILLLDVPVDSRVERDFVAALAARSPDMLATIPDGDDGAREALVALGGTLEHAPDRAQPDTDLTHLRRYVFTVDRPPIRDRSGDVGLFSAPGEGREATEIVRRVLDEAARGVPFDEMAVVLRVPQQYLGLLEHACDRGGVPVYFDRGTRRPDPAGRAFIALLSCATEGLSAKRFDEYLSLGQVPPAPDRRPTPMLIVPDDEVFRDRFSEEGDRRTFAAAEPAPGTVVDSDEEAVVAGTLRSPWKWEELIVESAVIGGRGRRDGKARWRRRLDGLAADYEYRIAELRREEPESPRVAACERDLRNLGHLRAFALPVIDELADWPDETSWGDWLHRFAALATRVLWHPDRTLKTLADLQPMADVGPVTLDEARDVLRDRLATLDWDPPARRYGRLFVGTPHQIRGRTFRVVFMPGLAERLVPQRPREDPLLLDDRRETIDGELARQQERGSAERLLLKVAIGSATERLYLSYPRLDVAEGRARVPSFYALDVMRAITGRVPDHRTLAEEAAGEGGASLAWPAPKAPERAIDDVEHDLAMLKPLLDAKDPKSVRGHGHYLLHLNDALRRSIVSRWARGRPQWSTSDGLVRVIPALKTALDRQRLGARSYSLSALQRFASCPYQFFLASIHRLEPRDDPEPFIRMDPLTKGSLFHRVQAEFYRSMDRDRLLPVSRENLAQALRTLDTAFNLTATEYAERLAPAIDRVWRDEIAELRRDLGIWVQKLADESIWRPEYFEFSFGLGVGPQGAAGATPARALELDTARDPRSIPEAIVIDGRFRLRGAVDLVERRTDLGVLRVTDHKTGKNRSHADLIVGGGSVLQPVLYSVALEQGLGKKVVSGRLYYCTTAGGFADHDIPVNAATKAQGLEVLAVIDRSIERGFLPAAPADRACTWCDFKLVCGPREEERIREKATGPLADLEALRSMR